VCGFWLVFYVLVGLVGLVGWFCLPCNARGVGIVTVHR